MERDNRRGDACTCVWDADADAWSDRRRDTCAVERICGDVDDMCGDAAVRLGDCLMWMGLGMRSVDDVGDEDGGDGDADDVGEGDADVRVGVLIVTGVG